MEKTNLISHLNPRDLELIILPTEQCNFRCTYCYEDFEIGHMKENTVEAVKNMIRRRLPSLRRLRIGWFGGEPLAARATVLNICRFAQDICREAGVVFHSNMTTNAYSLDAATFAQLVKLGVTHYQISLDGDAEEHNKTRKLMSGGATFARIWNNLLSLRENEDDFTITLRVHVHIDNFASVKVLLDKICAEFGADPRFVILLKTVSNWGGDSVKQLALIKDKKQALDELKAQLRAAGWFDSRAEDNDKQKTPCYAALSNSFVVRATGALAKCTVAFADPRNHVGSLNDDGSMTLENEKMRSFMRGFETMEDRDLGCPMQGMPALNEVKVIMFDKMPKGMAQTATASA